ncbi:MAG: SDR family oxidoreductase [Chloroflexota bacterium]|nr:MAG: SDR family oxidoreductase [Chloroflexota bacterium]
MAYEDLKGKVAIVTGAGQGIGETIALTLAGVGMNVAIADKNPVTAEQVAGKVQALGVKGLAVHVDVTDPASAEQMVQTVLSELGQIDVLVNNAGRIAYKKFTDLTLEDWYDDVNVNLHGVYLCSRAVVPHMIKRRSGRIITISSDSAKIAEIYTAAYSAAKGGANALMKVLARELGRYNITANAICPGMVKTPLLGDTFFGDLGEEKMKQMIKVTYPLGRIAETQDVADATLFLASDAAKYITGQTISVDGGYVMY